jgi:hypothetical protein
MRLVQVVGLALAVCVASAAPADAAKKKTAKKGLQVFQDFIGSWRGTGEPAGTREEKLKGFWQEKIAWEWRFKGDDVWLLAKFDKGKYFSAAELRYRPDRDAYELKATTPGKETLTFSGKLEKKRLTLERADARTKERQRLLVTLLHSNRYLYSYEVKPDGPGAYARQYQVGATKEGVAFASDDDGHPECVVSGGRGTIPVRHGGVTYYVCCTGCRDAFNDEPEKYIKEYEARKKAKKKKD